MTKQSGLTKIHGALILDNTITEEHLDPQLRAKLAKLEKLEKQVQLLEKQIAILQSKFVSED